MVVAQPLRRRAARRRGCREGPVASWRIFAGAGLLSVAVAATALIPSASNATFPGRNGEIVYVDEDTSNLSLVTPDGGDRQKLLSPPNANAGFNYPSFSADGRRIAYTLRYARPSRPGSDYFNAYEDIYTVNADGTGRKRLTHRKGRTFDRHPAFSPNGKLIIFDRTKAKKQQILVMRSNGSHLRKLTNGTYPSYSPDGRRIVFTRGKGSKGKGRILVARANGSHAHLVTRGADPRFSPDGKRIAFVAGPNLAHVKPYTIGVDGHGRRPLSSTPGRFGSPAFSPDGKQVVYRRWLAGTDEIFVLDVASGDTTNVADGDFPDWGAAG